MQVDIDESGNDRCSMACDGLGGGQALRYAISDMEYLAVEQCYIGNLPLFDIGIVDTGIGNQCVNMHDWSSLQGSYGFPFDERTGNDDFLSPCTPGDRLEKQMRRAFPGFLDVQVDGGDAR